MTKMDIGVMVWGGVGVLIGLIALRFVCVNFTSPEIIAPVLAALVATIGVVWSWFFQLSQKDKHHKDIMALEREKLSLGTSEEVH